MDAHANVVVGDLPTQRLQIAALMQSLSKSMMDGTLYVEVLNRMFDELATIVPYDRLGIAILEDNGHTAVLRWMKARTVQPNLPIGYSAAIHGSSLEQILISRAPRIINDLVAYFTSHPDSNQTKSALADGVRSSLTLPLLAAGRPVGFVFFSSATPNVYANEHASLLALVADELSLIVEFGRLTQFFEANKSYQQFLRTAIHDLRAPLCTIQGFIQLVQDQPWYCHADQSTHDVYAILLRNVKFMFDLLNDLAGADAGTHALVAGKHVTVDLQDFLAEFEASATMLAKAKAMTFALALGDLPPTWQFERVSIRQVLNNLLTNAIKFSHPDTNVSLVVKVDAERLTFCMADHGQGIPPGELSKLFNEFGKTSVLPTAGESSTGLGLSIVKRIVESHGGQVTADSCVGQGSTFVFWLPKNAALSLH